MTLIGDKLVRPIDAIARYTDGRGDGESSAVAKNLGLLLAGPRLPGGDMTAARRSLGFLLEHIPRAASGRTLEYYRSVVDEYNALVPPAMRFSFAQPAVLRWGAELKPDPALVRLGKRRYAPVQLIEEGRRLRAEASPSLGAPELMVDAPRALAAIRAESGKGEYAPEIIVRGWVEDSPRSMDAAARSAFNWHALVMEAARGYAAGDMSSLALFKSLISHSSMRIGNEYHELVAGLPLDPFFEMAGRTPLGVDLLEQIADERHLDLSPLRNIQPEWDLCSSLESNPAELGAALRLLDRVKNPRVGEMLDRLVSEARGRADGIGLLRRVDPSMALLGRRMREYRMSDANMQSPSCDRDVGWLAFEMGNQDAIGALSPARLLDEGRRLRASDGDGFVDPARVFDMIGGEAQRVHMNSRPTLIKYASWAYPGAEIPDELAPWIDLQPDSLEAAARSALNWRELVAEAARRCGEGDVDYLDMLRMLFSFRDMRIGGRDLNFASFLSKDPFLKAVELSPHGAVMLRMLNDRGVDTGLLSGVGDLRWNFARSLDWDPQALAGHLEYLSESNYPHIGRAQEGILRSARDVIGGIGALRSVDRISPFSSAQLKGYIPSAANGRSEDFYDDMAWLAQEGNPRARGYLRDADASSGHIAEAPVFGTVDVLPADGDPVADGAEQLIGGGAEFDKTNLLAQQTDLGVGLKTVGIKA